MNFLKILYIVVSLLGLGTFYYLMALEKESPQRKLGKDFKMPDVHLHYTPELLYNTYEEAGEDGRRMMRQYWLYDFGLIATLVGVMLAVSANVVSSKTWVYPLMIWLTLLRAGVDVLEDLMFLFLLRCFPEYRYGAARFTGWITTIKHLLLLTWVLLLFMMLFLAAFGIS